MDRSCPGNPLVMRYYFSRCVSPISGEQAIATTEQIAPFDWILQWFDLDVPTDLRRQSKGLWGRIVHNYEVADWCVDHLLYLHLSRLHDEWALNLDWR